MTNARSAQRPRGGVGSAALAALAAFAVVVAPALDPVARVEANRRVWEARRPPSYEYTLEVVCFCVGPRSYAVSIVDGRVDQVTPELRYPASTIDDLFDDVHAAFAGGDNDAHVSYDSRLGYPARFSTSGDASMSDDEWTFDVTMSLPPTTRDG